MRHPIRGDAAKLLLAGLIFGLWTGFAAAHVRGEVTAINGDVATVKTVSGETVEVTCGRTSACRSTAGSRSTT